MRGIAALGIGAVACATALLPGPASAAGAAGFAGTWVSNDVVDGSFQTLDVSGSAVAGTYGTRLYDTVAQVCGGGPANVEGPGRVDDDQLFVTFTLSCPGGKSALHGRVGTLVYAYDAASDTLSDDSGNVWYRA